MVIMLLEGIAIICVILLLAYTAGRLLEPPNLPPGPRPLPLLGNLLDLDMKCVHLSFMKLAEKYGSIFTVYLGGQRTVIVNCLSGMREALITRKDDYAGRPRSYVHDFLFWNSSDVAFQDFGPKLILQRKLLHTALRHSKKQTEDIFKLEVAKLIKKFQACGESRFDPKEEVQVCIANARKHVLFGERSDENDYDHIEFNDRLFLAISSVSVLDMFPWLIHFPLKVSKELKYLAKQRDKIFLTEYEEHLETFTEGKHRDLTDSLIQAQKDEERENSLEAKKLINKYNVVGMMADVLLAGSDTTSAGVLWILVFLLRHPDVQEKIHRELDEIVGRERPPVIDDKDKLPFLEAAIYETFRLSPWGTICVPHKVTRNSTIQGYEIPEGTTVLFNLYALNRDITAWKDPLAFNPRRFIDEDGKCTPKYGNITTFSAGRRKCAGEALAKADLFLIMSRLLQRFQFVNPPGCSPPGLDADFGLVSKPFPFKICCRDRLA